MEQINQDKFLFACLEHEKTCSALNRACFTPGFESDHASKLEEELKNLLEHYKTNTAEIRAKEAISADDLPEIVPPIVGFSQDLQKIFEAKDDAVAPFVDGDHDSYWSVMVTAFDGEFAGIGKYYLSFLKWYFGQQVVADQPQAGNSYDRNSGNRGGNRRDGGRDGGRGRRDNRGGGGGKRRPRLSPEEFRAEMEKRAMKNVDDGISTMQTEEERGEFKLRSANSYHRRLQHQLISDAGLFSFSAGEGRSRAVVITRDESKKSEANPAPEATTSEPSEAETNVET